ncbi:hypothetical protein ACFV6W_46340, partial [Streptomyces sp. NPDC059802]
PPRPRPPPPARPPAAPAGAPTAETPPHRVPPGSWHYFGTQKARAAIESVQDEDLADVVGEEALAAHRTGTAGNRGGGVGLVQTAHDETEQLDVAELRSAIS